MSDADNGRIIDHGAIRHEEKGPAYYSDGLVERIAMVAHEANRVFCQFIGDMSQHRWQFAPEWQRESSRAGVRTVLESPFVSPEDIHAAWCDHKRAEGWVYGPEKDAEKKTHPCLVDYAALPREQQFKDLLFTTIARASLESPGQSAGA